MSQRISGRRSCVVRESGQRSRAPRQSAAQENARDRARAHPARGSRRRARRFRARSRLRRSRPTRPLGHEPLRRHARTQALPSRAMSSRTRSTVASALVDGMPNLCIMGGVTAATRWPETRATRGLVATPHALASEAGVAILKRGGNAVDAAIAAATTIAVVYPHMNGVGGDSFWLIYDGRRRTLRALNAAGRSAAAADLDRYRARFGAAIPARGGAAALTVPGVVSGWWEAHALSRDLLGSPIDWPTLLDDAITRAREPLAPRRVRRPVAHRGRLRSPRRRGHEARLRGPRPLSHGPDLRSRPGRALSRSGSPRRKAPADLATGGKARARRVDRGRHD